MTYYMVTYNELEGEPARVVQRWQRENTLKGARSLAQTLSYYVRFEHIRIARVVQEVDV